jgi:hypothetical protein
MTHRLRLAYAGSAALLLLGTGLWFGGATGRVYALVRAAASSPQISPIDGSRTAPARQIVLDGQPARVRRCLAPKTWSVAQVRDHYEDMADAESRFESGERVPYVALDQAEGAYVLWTCVKDGHRKGVIVQRSAGGVEYTLFDSEALEPARTKGGSSSVLLPGGAQAPAGSRSAFSVEDGASSFSFFESPGSPPAVADQLKQSLVGAGFEVDTSRADSMDLVNHAPQGSPARIIVPFKGKEKKGLLIVAPLGVSTSRATVVLR